MWKDFKEFAIKGNMIDLAIGVVLGAAFGGVINSIVNDLLTPFIAWLFQSPDFSNMFVLLKRPEITDGINMHSIEEVRKAGGVALGYGLLLNTFINFFIIAIVLFGIVRIVHRKRKEEAAAAAPPPGPTQEQLLAEIRDLLKARQQ